MKNKDKAIDKYFSLFDDICKWFGYVEDWKVIALDDRRNRYWTLKGDGSKHSDEVWFCNDRHTQEILASNGFDCDDERCKTKNIYQFNIYTQRFLPKYIYRTEEHTMICVDTGCDGNKYLSIFDNEKEIKIK